MHSGRGGYKVDSVFYDRVTVFDKICSQRAMTGICKAHEGGNGEEEVDGWVQKSEP